MMVVNRAICFFNALILPGDVGCPPIDATPLSFINSERNSLSLDSLSSGCISLNSKGFFKLICHHLSFRLFYLQVGDGRPPDAQVLPRVLVGHPREPQGAHDQRATFPVTPLRVLDRVHAVRDPLARPRLELPDGGVEADGSILPDLVEGLGGEVLEGRVGHRRG